MKKNEQHITIADIAKKANVSKTTISRYLNEKYEYMSSETREKISAIIKETNYRPNKFAQGLKSKKSHFIGISLADIGNPYSALMLKGINDYCKKNHFQMIITNADNDQVTEKQNIESLIDTNVEGLLINATGYNQALLDQLIDQGVPVVLLDRSTENRICDAVTTNDAVIMQSLLEHLITNGFRSFIYITENIQKISTRFIRQSCFHHFISCNDEIYGKTYTVDINKKADIKTIIRREYQDHINEQPVIIAANGEVLQVILECLYALDLSIPNQMGLCGFGDPNWTKLTHPSITVIDQNAFAIGQKAMECLALRLTGDRALPEHFEIPGTLLIRQSTKRM
ncbi:LacI family DNA-binding transcriptional regulator [Terrilactibacillus laevilacticus]|uniref:LacI family DNA-binding transcriptional regulator n=1 Tax=Terrilactibacillus laevilacticus TaxID=1380157 RepID=A0ABW5PRL7_9BACI|nr:LacI family DNA-binding transcriptional regulator [Terrilactibacillus laevilacticus]